MRVFRRGLVASDTPVQYSKGFNPHPRLSFGPSLRTGWQGLDEYLDVVLERPVPDLAQRCNPCLPEGLEILETALVDDAVPKLAGDVVAARYEIAIDPDDLDPSANESWRTFLERAQAIDHDLPGQLDALQRALEEHYGGGQTEPGGAKLPRLLEARVCKTKDEAQNRHLSRMTDTIQTVAGDRIDPHSETAGEIQIEYLSEMTNGRSLAPDVVVALFLGDPADLETIPRVTRKALYVRRGGGLVPPISNEVVRPTRPKRS